MADPNGIDTLNSELDNRLDDLFGETDVPLLNAQDEKLKEHYPLAELKNLILSIDWEITDEVLEKLIQQVKDLQLMYKHDKIVMSFLQILNSLGNYIKAHRAKAHPKTFKILNSVFSNLDKVVLDGDMSESAKKKILHAEIQRYKELRNQIAKDKKTAGQSRTNAKSTVTKASETPQENDELVIKLDEPAAGPEIAAKKEDPVVEPESDTSPATLAEAVEEIKRYIHLEFQTLKEEIHSLKDQK